ncbi:MAG: putative ABC transporter periplasmic-binding protein [Methanosaeta sp. PtaU1.Bin112]|nr:MAG: putative ABC transporter periplasmic-binding protein [Methanosaeta sp. PtaU1.Bin112]
MTIKSSAMGRAFGILFLSFFVAASFIGNVAADSGEDPLVIAASSSFFTQGNVLSKGGVPTGSFAYEGLIARNREGGYDGWLAKSWESNDDASIWTFHLVDNATWHDGEPFTSEDVKFTHDYLKKKKLWLSSVLSKVDHVECPDENTAIFYLKTPFSAFLDSLSHCPGIGIIPKHIWESVDDPDHYADDKFIGTGPFKFEKAISEQYVKLVANENYHGQKPQVKEAILKIITNKDSQILSLRSGDVDVVSDISPAVAKSLIGSQGIDVSVVPDTRGYELGMQCNNSPTDNKDFRNAMAHAINRERICDIVFDGYAHPTMTTFLMPVVAHDFVNEDVPGDDYGYDLKKAKDLLESAGFLDSDGDGWREGPDKEKLNLIFVIQGNGADASGRMAEVLKEEWKQIGLDVKIKLTESEQYSEERRHSNFFISGMPYLMHDDADDLSHFECNSYFGQKNWYDFSNQRYNELNEKLRSIADRDERRKIGYEMQEILADEVPSVPICSADLIFAHRSDRFAGWENLTPLYWDVDTKMLLNLKRA